MFVSVDLEGEDSDLGKMLPLVRREHSELSVTDDYRYRAVIRKTTSACVRKATYKTLIWSPLICQNGRSRLCGAHCSIAGYPGGGGRDFRVDVLPLASALRRECSMN